MRAPKKRCINQGVTRVAAATRAVAGIETAVTAKKVAEAVTVTAGATETEVETGLMEAVADSVDLADPRSTQVFPRDNLASYFQTISNSVL